MDSGSISTAHVATTWPAPALPPSPQPSLGPAPAAAVALFLFGCTACFAGCRFSCRAGKPSGDNLTPVGIGMCRRRFMVGGLLAANIVRCISLAAEMLLQSHACPYHEGIKLQAGTVARRPNLVNACNTLSVGVFVGGVLLGFTSLHCNNCTSADAGLGIHMHEPGMLCAVDSGCCFHICFQGI